MIKKLGEHVDRHPGVGLALAMPAVDHDPGSVELAAVGAGSVPRPAIHARWRLSSICRVMGRRPAGLRRGEGSSFSSPAGVAGNRARVRRCWAAITWAVDSLTGSRRPSRPALALS